MGVVLYTMLVGKFPFKNIQDIIEGRFEMPLHISPSEFLLFFFLLLLLTTSKKILACASLIKKMLTVDSKKRITLKQIQEDPWVRENIQFKVKQIDCTVIETKTNAPTNSPLNPPHIVPEQMNRDHFQAPNTFFPASNQQHSVNIFGTNNPQQVQREENSKKRKNVENEETAFKLQKK